MDKNKITSNDILDALSIRINDALRPHSKRNDNKKNNAYFWLCKMILMILYIFVIVIVFNLMSSLGVTIIYEVSNSLRSILSTIWVDVLDFTKSLIVIYLLYDNFKTFTASTYYKNLYKKDERMIAKKEKTSFVIETILKILAAVLLIATGIVSTLALFGFIYMIIMLINGTYLVSPLIIMFAVFIICYFAFKFIQNKFFSGKSSISKTHFIVSFIVLALGAVAFAYEISSFEYLNALPNSFELTKKEQSFNIGKDQKINIKSDSKLDNLKVLVDNDLIDQIRVEVEYFRTADVKYVYNFNEYDDLNLTFTSDLNFEFDNTIDVMKLFVSTFNNKIVYNYNLFKYPNIYVYVNSNDIDRISVG